jgi:autotransporter-associated beta strand protein
MNGGAVNVQTNFYVVYRDSASERANNGRLYMNGGVLDVKGTLYVTRNSKTTAEAWLNEGGLLKAGDITGTRTGGKFYFNGGTFMPYGVLPNGSAAAAFADSSLDALVSTNGVVIDTSSVADGTYTIAAALKHDPALAGADGGLVKKGAGTLALSGANTFTGPVVIEEGVLQALGDTALPSVTEVRYGTALDLGGASRMVGGLAGDGVVQNGTLVLAGPIVAGKGVPFLDCNLETAKGAAIDFGCTEANPVQVGKTFLVAQIADESAVGNLRFKAVNSGLDNCGVGVTVADGNVYVTTETRGMTLLVR